LDLLSLKQTRSIKEGFIRALPVAKRLRYSKEKPVFLCNHFRVYLLKSAYCCSGIAFLQPGKLNALELIIVQWLKAVPSSLECLPQVSHGVKSPTLSIVNSEGFPGDRVHGDELHTSYQAAVQKHFQSIVGTNSPEKDRISDTATLRAQRLGNLAIL
jgi:hypothetical protein